MFHLKFFITSWFYVLFCFVFFNILPVFLLRKSCYSKTYKKHPILCDLRQSKMQRHFRQIGHAVCKANPWETFTREDPHVSISAVFVIAFPLNATPELVVQYQLFKMLEAIIVSEFVKRYGMHFNVVLKVLDTSERH